MSAKPTNNPKPKKTRKPRKKANKANISKEAVSTKQMALELSKTRKLVQGNMLSRFTTPNIANVKRIVEYLTMPMSPSEVVRYAQQVGNSKTAVAQPFERIAALFATVPVPGSGTLRQNPNTGFAAKFRDPFRSSIHYHPYLVQSAWTYSGTFNKPISNPAVVSSILLPPISLATPTNTIFAPHGNVLYAGVPPSADQGYYWVQDGDAIRISWNTLSGSSPTATVVYAEYWNYNTGTSEVYAQSGVIVGDGVFSTGPTPLIIAPGAYCSFRLGVSAGAVTANVQYTVQIIHTAIDAADIYCHRPTADLNFNQVAAGDMRHVSSSIMFTNTTAVLLRGGQVSQKQVPKSVNWFDTLNGGDPYSYIAGMNDAWSEKADDGYYSFLKVVETKDLDLFNQIPDTAFNVNVGGHWFLLNDSEYVVSATVMNSTTPNGYYTFCDGLEYLTNDRWRSLACPDTTTADWSMALQLVTEMPQYHKNFFHIADILRFFKSAIRDVAGAVVDYGPSVVDLASKLKELAM